MRLEGKVGIVVGAGQTPGGRSATVVLRRAVRSRGRQGGARRSQACESAERDRGDDRRGGWRGVAVAGDWTQGRRLPHVRAASASSGWGRVDFLHNNVGIGHGDDSPGRLTEDVFDRIVDVNLKGCLLSCQAVLPVMRQQQSGSIVNISSIAAVASTPLTAYKISKIGMNALGQSLVGRLRQARHPREHDHAGADGHADGHRRRRRGGRDLEGRAAGAARPCGAAARTRWAARGTSPTPRCGCTPTTRRSSPGWCSPSTAAERADRLSGQVRL